MLDRNAILPRLSINFDKTKYILISLMNNLIQLETFQDKTETACVNKTF